MREIIENTDAYKADINTKTPYGRISLPHGDTVFLNKGLELCHLSVLELPQGKMRGNHYHKERIEYLYILKGNIWGYYWDHKNPLDARKVLLCPGQIVTIPPGLSHALEAIEDAIAIEFSPHSFDISDYYHVENPMQT